MSAVTFRVDTQIVPFRIHAECLQVLLLETGGWHLPQAALQPATDLDAAARSHLARQTGLDGVYLEQLYTFARNGAEPGIAVTYFAIQAAGAEALAGAAWHAAESPPATLPACEAETIALARQRVAAKLDYSTIALQFMAPRFTLSALQGVYEAVLGEPLDKRNFRKRVLAQGRIEDSGEMSREGNHRPARLYRAKSPDRVEIIK